MVRDQLRNVIWGQPGMSGLDLTLYVNGEWQIYPNSEGHHQSGGKHLVAEGYEEAILTIVVRLL